MAGSGVPDKGHGPSPRLSQGGAAPAVGPRRPTQSVSSPAAEKEGGSTDVFAGAANMDVQNFAERLRAQREAAERLISRRGGDAAAEPSASAPSPRLSKDATSWEKKGVGLSDTPAPEHAPKERVPGAAGFGAAAHVHEPETPPAESGEKISSTFAKPGADEAAGARAQDRAISSTGGAASTAGAGFAGPPAPSSPLHAPEVEAHSPGAPERDLHADMHRPDIAQGPAHFGPESSSSLAPGADLLDQAIPGGQTQMHGVEGVHDAHHAPHGAQDLQGAEAEYAATHAGEHDVYTELEQLDERPRKNSMILVAAIFVLIAALAAAAVFVFFGNRGERERQATRQQVPVINPPAKPAKVKPESGASGEPAPVRRKLIYDRIIDENAPKTKPPQPSASPPVQEPQSTPLPPPLPPPPSLGDDQGKTKSAPPSPEQGDERDFRTAGNERTTIAPASGDAGGSESRSNGATPSTVAKEPGTRPVNGKDEAGEAIAAGDDELSRAVRAFASSGEKPSEDADADRNKARKVAGATGIALPRVDDQTREAGPVGSASSGSGAKGMTEAAKRKAANAPRLAVSNKPARQANRETAGQAMAKGQKTSTKRMARTIGAKKSVATASAARRPEPKPKARPKAKARSQPVEVASRGTRTRNTSSRGPIALPGAIPLTTPQPSAGRASTLTPANRRGIVRGQPFLSAPQPPVTPRKRANFKQVKVKQAGAPNKPARAALSSSRTPTKITASARPPRRVASIGRAPGATAQRVAGGGYKVQLAAFRSQQDALRAWQRIRAKHGRILGGLKPIITRKNLGDAGTFYRLSIGPLPSRQQASRLCQQLIARGEPDCLIRK